MSLVFRRFCRFFSNSIQRSAPANPGYTSSAAASSNLENAPEFDLVVLGSGPAGQKAAIAASKMRKSVCLVDAASMLGGVCVHTGTIPSKTLREAILFLTGVRQRFFYGRSFSVSDRINHTDLTLRVDTLIKEQVEVVNHQLRRNNITILDGFASFVSPHEIKIERSPTATVASAPAYVKGKNILISVGSRPAHAPHIPFDGVSVFDADQILKADWTNMPRDLIVVGAGVIGLEYASMFSALPGVSVTIIDERSRLLDIVDREVVHALYFYMRRGGATFRLGEKVVEVTKKPNGRVTARLASGKQVNGDALLYCVGRDAATDTLNLAAAGLTSEKRGAMKVNDNYQTEVPHIYAAGDCIGFPALASSSMEQGRIAAQAMFEDKLVNGADSDGPKMNLLPIGIYTLPEISMVGPNEKELTQRGIPFESGVARYEEIAKGQMVGDTTGFVKILFCPNTLKILSVHCIGDSAAEILHIGLVAMACNSTIRIFVDNIFNYPTLAECYKVAALDGLNKLQ